nr:hypothetical protein BaRGS_008273 [Batillaria attramentaria]
MINLDMVLMEDFNANDTSVHTQMVFLASFLQNNRLEHVHQVMGYHPAYVEAFVKTQHFLLREDGPLPFHYRHFIAIMTRRTNDYAQVNRLLDRNLKTYIKTVSCYPRTHHQKDYDGVMRQFKHSEKCKLIAGRR